MAKPDAINEELRCALREAWEAACDREYGDAEQDRFEHELERILRRKDKLGQNWRGRP